MTEKKHDYYQPWLRDPAPMPEASAPARDASDQGGLAKPKDEPPVGIDLARYKAAEKPQAPLVKPEAIKAGAARLWDRARDGAEAFADWTIGVGERADIPARVEAMEIPRRFMWLKARELIFPSFIMRVLLLACAGAARVLAFYGFSLYTVQAYSNYTVHAYSIWRKPHA